MQANRPNAGEIASAIVESFKTLPGRIGSGQRDRVWTRQLKDDIGTLGERHGWTICTGGFKDRFEAGWLYDLIWYDEADGHLSEVYLVLESEWGRSRLQIKYDFEKLLLAKSTIKVMVFQTNNVEIEALFKYLEDGIRSFPLLQSRDETYLLLAFNNDHFEFDIRWYNGYGVQLASAGSDRAVDQIRGGSSTCKDSPPNSE